MTFGDVDSGRIEGWSKLLGAVKGVKFVSNRAPERRLYKLEQLDDLIRWPALNGLHHMLTLGIHRGQQLARRGQRQSGVLVLAVMLRCWRR